MRSRPFAGWFLTALCAISFVAAAQKKPVELPGAEDPSQISRYAGSVLVNVADEPFAAVRVPAGPGHYTADKLAFDQGSTVEGRVRAYFYVQPKERTALEVFRNYQSALVQAGFTPLFACELRVCDEALIRDPFAAEVLRSRRWKDGRSDPSGAVSRDVRFLSARRARAGVDTSIMVFVAEPDSVWQAPVAAVVVAEAGAMLAGQVVVGTERLQKGLVEEGKVALYGVYFDTGRAELKAESKPQLDEMARLLAADKSLKVAIVGHTDNQGSVDANESLSRRRAEAVVAALVSGYKVDASRLRARGVASFAPVASNRTEAGRAKNRRVEIIEQ